MKIAACVILYNPQQSIEKNIQSYINVDRIYVIDNTEFRNINSELLSVYNSNIVLFHNGVNEGIAKRLNQACGLAITDGYEFLLTMDQDSYFEEESINKYFECLENFPFKERVAMFGINHQRQNNIASCTAEKVKSLITSGSIINLAAYKVIGGFDENLFIDFVDTDYCFKSILKGYDLIEFPNIFMHHEIGITIQHRSLKNLKSSKRSLHSAIRLYYMTRNFFYLNKKYKDDFKAELSAQKKDLQIRIKNKLLYDNNRLLTMQYIVQARKDYKRKNMGKKF